MRDDFHVRIGAEEREPTMPENAKVAATMADADGEGIPCLGMWRD
jgi:hypothetical protein